MAKIKKLTAAQEAKIAEYAKRWTEIGLSTLPADRPRAEAAIIEMYRVAGLSRPKIIWCGSPMAQGLTRAIILDKNLMGNVRASVRDSVRASVGDSVGDSVWASVRASVGDSVWASVGDSVWASVGDSVWASVRASVRDSVGASVRDSVGASVWDSVGASVWDSVGASVWTSVRDSVGASVWASVGDSVGDSVWASVRASVRDSVRASVGDSVGDSVWASVWASVRASVRDSVGASVRDSVGASVWDSVGASVWDSVRDSVGASVWDSVGASVWDSVGASVWTSVRDSVRASVGDSVYGQHDANWLAFYKFFRDECGLTVQTEKLSGLVELCESAGWALPHKNICWVSERHNVLARDDRGRLHSIAGPACAYPDGWAIYAIHGTRIPEKWITEPKSLTPKVALTWRNVEQRRAACEILGWENILRELKAKSIDKDEDPMIGELVEVDLPDIGREKFLRVLCGTGRRFALPMPPHIKTALEGNAWSFAVDTQVLKTLEART